MNSIYKATPRFIVLIIVFHWGGLFNPIAAQVSFEVTNISGTNVGSIQNCIADMNGDYLDDVVRVVDDHILISYQQPNGEFRDRSLRMDLTIIPFWSIAVGDLDANGFNDMIFGGPTSVSFLYADINGSSYNEDHRIASIIPQRTSISDIDNDGDLDAFICHDTNQNHPYRNDGTGTLTLDQSLIETPANLPGNYVSTFVDYDNDGDTDMHISKCVQSSDPGDLARTNLMFNNDGQGNFTEVAAQIGMADNEQSWITLFEDFDNDGDFDAFVVNHSDANRYLVNQGDGTYVDEIIGSGLPMGPNSATEALAADFDNNGFVDIIINDPPVMVLNEGGSFRVIGDVGEASAIGDLNNDGYIDIAFGDRMWINTTPKENHWLVVNTKGGDNNNVNGIGSRVEIYGDWGKQMREVRVAQSWKPMSTLNTHFGLGEYDQVDSLVVTWPSGTRTVIDQPAIDSKIFVDEGGCELQSIPMELLGATFLCDSMSTMIAAPRGFSDYLWSNGADTEQITVDEPGFYNVTVTDANGCTGFSQPIQLQSEAEVLNIVTPDGTFFCEGSGVLLEVEPNQDLQWNTGSTDPLLIVREPGDYFATYTNLCGNMVSTDTVTITLFSAPPPIVDDISVSSNSGPITIEAQGDLVTWWDSEVGGQILSNTSILEVEVVSDTIFWAESVFILPNGSICSSIRVPIRVTIVSSTDDALSSLGIEIYPNPTEGFLTVKTNGFTSATTVRILDTKGQTVMSLNMEESVQNISLSDQPQGVYLIQLVSNEGTVTKKIVKQQ